MISIACVNIKGGVGKTTTVVNIASCMNAYLHKRVLVVDTDAQSNATSYLLMNQEINSDTFANVCDCINGVSVKEAIIPIHFQNKNNKADLSLLSASNSIETLDFDDISILRNKLSEIESDYDYCFFDCPPHLSPLALAAMCASDYILVPALPDSDSLSGYSQLIDAVNGIKKSTTNNNLEILGIFFNSTAINNALDRFIISTLKETQNSNIFSQSIRRSTIATQCRYFGEPICIRAEKTPISQDYIKLTKQINNKIICKRKGSDN